MHKIVYALSFHCSKHMARRCISDNPSLEARSYCISIMFVCVLNVGCLSSVTNQILYCAYRI